MVSGLRRQEQGHENVLQVAVDAFSANEVRMAQLFHQQVVGQHHPVYRRRLGEVVERREQIGQQPRFSPLGHRGNVAAALRQDAEAERGGGRRLESALHPLGNDGHDAGAGAPAQAAEREQIAVVLPVEHAAVGQRVADRVRALLVFEDVVDGRGPAQQGESSRASGPSYRVAAALLLVGQIGAALRRHTKKPPELRRRRRIER